MYKMKRFWKIECEEGIKKTSSMIVPTNQFSEKKVVELIKLLFTKYTLTDEEILSSLIRTSSSIDNNLIKIERHSELDFRTDQIRICFSAKSSLISITANLIYEDELTEIEKGEINI